MQLISLNVGLPRLVLRNDEPVSTGIYKEPVTGRIKLRRLNLDGDRQADLTVHGGPEKAVYAYPSEHYEFWRRELPGMDMPWGMFGENFTITGLDEFEVNIGDTFEVGSAKLMATQPRMPCFKLAMRFGRNDILKRFLESQRTGFYLSVLKEGDVGVGDEISRVQKNNDGVRVVDITRLYTKEKNNVELLRRAIATDGLAEGWIGYFEDRLERLTGSPRRE